MNDFFRLSVEFAAGGGMKFLFENRRLTAILGKQEVFERFCGAVACLLEWPRSKFCERIASKEFRVPQQGRGNFFSKKVPQV